MGVAVFGVLSVHTKQIVQQKGMKLAQKGQQAGVRREGDWMICAGTVPTVGWMCKERTKQLTCLQSVI